MKRYGKYKDSGIEWIGKIPVHWNIKKVKYNFIFRTGFTPPTGKNEYYDDGIHTWINISDMNSRIIIDSVNKITEKAIQDFRPTIAPKGSLLYSFKLTVGKVAFNETDCYTNEAIFSIDPGKSVNLNFFYYSLPEQIIKNANENIYGAKILNQELIKNANLVVPLPNEQTTIANYLDSKTTEINELIADKKRLLKLYEEEKTAIINQAVTKGLDSNVPMKDSGIKWLGEIPKHWNILKLARTVSKLTNGYVGPIRGVMQSHGVPYVQGIHIKNNTIEFTPLGNYYVDEKWSDNHQKSVLAKDDILVVQTGTIGDVGIVPKKFEGANCHALLILRARRNIYYSEYLLNLFTSRFGFNSLQLIKTGEILYHINGSKLKGINVLIPPLKEQQSIIYYIETECNRIATKINKTQKLIDLLTEYRTALISEVVTGKIKVTD